MASLTGNLDTMLPWSSPAIPDWTRAAPGAMTRSGEPAVFGSSTQAWIALRLVYVADVLGHPPADVADRADRYRTLWDRYRDHGLKMQQLAAALDNSIKAAADVWNAIDQPAVNDAYTAMICERECFPKTNLATMALRHFGLQPAPPDPAIQIDLPSTQIHNQAAWLDATGLCRSCGAATISQHQYAKLRKALAAHPDVFDLTPPYEQYNGKIAPLWSNRVLIAAKGVADHIDARSAGGRTNDDNLANVCSACNYSRNNADLNTTRVAAFTRR